jgi:hypothetical protein
LVRGAKRFRSAAPQDHGVKKSTQTQYSQLLEAVETFKSSLKLKLENSKEMLAAAKGRVDKKTEDAVE